MNSGACTWKAWMKMCGKFYVTLNKKRALLNKQLDSTLWACCRHFKHKTAMWVSMVLNWCSLCLWAVTKKGWFDTTIRCFFFFHLQDKQMLAHFSERTLLLGQKGEKTDFKSLRNSTLLQTQICADLSHILHKVLWFWFALPSFGFCPWSTWRRS